jgi:hypothetical protein
MVLHRGDRGVASYAVWADRSESTPPRKFPLRKLDVRDATSLHGVCTATCCNIGLRNDESQREDLRIYLQMNTTHK